MIMFVRAISICTLLVLANAALAQTGYPNRPVRVIVPFAPGGPSDAIARLLMQKFSENLGQQFYIENHAGGGGNLGTALSLWRSAAIAAIDALQVRRIVLRGAVLRQCARALHAGSGLHQR